MMQTFSLPVIAKHYAIDICLYQIMLGPNIVAGSVPEYRQAARS